MKATFLFLSFLLFSISAHTFVCSAAEAPEAVLDTNGEELRVGEEYYVGHAIWPLGGGARVSSFGNETCPPSVILSRFEVDPGLPLTFIPVDPTESVVRVSTDLNIKFTVSTYCIETNVWTLQHDEYTGEYVIYTNGTAGNPGPDTFFNWFKIEKYAAFYKIVFCPDVCDFCQVRCKNVGIFFQDGKRRLVLTDDISLMVIFTKASTSSAL